jgi:hypothetical protein
MLARKTLYNLGHFASPVSVLGIFEIGSLELFVWALNCDPPDLYHLSS